MNHSFPHLKNAIAFVMSQFELDEQEAMDYIMDNFWEEDNQMIVDIFWSCIWYSRTFMTFSTKNNQCTC